MIAYILFPSLPPSLSHLLGVGVEAEVDEKKEEGEGGGRVLPAHDVGVARFERPQVSKEGLKDGGGDGWEGGKGGERGGARVSASYLQPV